MKLYILSLSRDGEVEEERMAGRMKRQENAEFVEWVREYRIVAIVRGLESALCERLAGALFEGGIRMMEVTFDQTGKLGEEETAGAIRGLCAAWKGKMLIGAGTVLSLQQLELAERAGASYIVTPNTSPVLIRKAKELGMGVLAGAMTPSEICEAYEAGADFVKIFPASVLGPAYIKAVQAPLGHIPMLAVGGINEKNIADYLKAGAAGAGVGGGLVSRKNVESGNLGAVRELAREYVKSVKGV